MNDLTPLNRLLPLSNPGLPPLPAGKQPQDLVEKIIHRPFEVLSSEAISQFLAAEHQAIGEADIENYIRLAYALLRAENPLPQFSGAPTFSSATPAKKMMAVLLQATSKQPFSEPLTVPDLILDYLTPIGDAFPEKHLVWLLTCLQWVAWHYNENAALTHSPYYLQVLQGWPPINQAKIDEVIPVLRQAVAQYAHAVQATGKPFSTVLSYPSPCAYAPLLPSLSTLCEKTPAPYATSPIAPHVMKGLPPWQFDETSFKIIAANGKHILLSAQQFKYTKILLSHPPDTLIRISSLLADSERNNFIEIKKNFLYKAFKKIEELTNIAISLLKVNSSFCTYMQNHFSAGRTFSIVSSPLAKNKVYYSTHASCWRMDPTTRTVSAPNGLSVQLSPKKYELIETLLTHPGQIFPATKLMRISGHLNRETLYLNGVMSAVAVIARATHIRPIINCYRNAERFDLWFDGSKYEVSKQNT